MQVQVHVGEPLRRSRLVRVIERPLNVYDEDGRLLSREEAMIGNEIRNATNAYYLEMELENQNERDPDERLSQFEQDMIRHNSRRRLQPSAS